MFKKYKNQDLDMAFWWKKNTKNSSDYVKLISDQLSKITNSSGDSKRKAQEECTKYLMGLKHFLLCDTEPKPTLEALDELYLAILHADLFYELVLHFNDLEFEARKEVVFIFSVCLNYSKDNKLVAVDYLVSQPGTVVSILRAVEILLQTGESPQDMFLMLGSMILECIRYERLCRIILGDPQLWKFFDFAMLPSFEVSTESLQILNNVFTKHPKLVSTEFFTSERNRLKFIKNINRLMAQGSYVTKRQSTKLLASLIIVRSNNQLMNTYIDSTTNLKLIMTLMTDKSKNLQLEAFNVFKVFVANPRKTKPVFDILAKNRDKLLRYFSNFGPDSQDATFMDEKEFIIQQIEALPRVVSASAMNGGFNVNTGTSMSTGGSGSGSGVPVVKTPSPVSINPPNQGYSPASITNINQ